MKQTVHSLIKILFTAIIVMASSASAGYCTVNVTLMWDANSPAPEGYRVFGREEGQTYNYSSSLYEGTETTCTLNGLVEGTTYYFVVRAYSGSLESADSEEVSYTPALVVPNQPPVANAGANQEATEGATVTLNGSASQDSDGTVVGYHWTQTGGPAVVIGSSNAAQATFQAPVVDLNGATLTFVLTVTDDDGSTGVAATVVSVLKSASTDIDGDNVPDVLDLFPNDPTEWADNDQDGIGDNQDPDDDNDGMSDVWENSYGLDPLTDDGDLDADGDGTTNLAEFQADTNPVAAPGNTVPDAPQIESISQDERVSLTPVLVSGAYFDADNDDHLQSRWQISTQPDFSDNAFMVLDEISTTQLTAYTVGEMLLDPDTDYFWRVQFVDARSGASDWSQTGTFRTLSADSMTDADLNGNGTPDSQEIDGAVDVNENGISDDEENNLRTIYTVEGQTVVGVEIVSEGATLYSVKSLPTDTIADPSVNLGFGLVGFRLTLSSGVTTATVTVSFSKRVPKDAKLYKYHTDSGWRVYEGAVFAANRKSVTYSLVDGGAGDEDGVVNEIIVDPVGVAYEDDNSAAVSTSTSDSSSGGGGGCFITASRNDSGAAEGGYSAKAGLALVLGLLIAGIAMAGAIRCRLEPAVKQPPA